MKLIENIRIALRSIQGNLLRTILTLLIISFGILALVGILTVIDVMLYSMRDSFSGMGANSFAIERLSTSFKTSTGRRKWKVADPVTYRQATDFKEAYSYPSTTSVYFYCKGDVVAKYEDEKTNPRNELIGVDENYLAVKDHSLAAGRFFSASEIEYGRSLAILGDKIVDQLYDGSAEKAIGSTVTLDSKKYKVIGVLEEKGSTLNNEADRVALIPLLTSKIHYGSQRSDYNIDVKIDASVDIDEAISAAIGDFRNVRNLRTVEPNDFEIEKSDSMLSMLKDGTQDLRWAAYFIGGITLLGAAIGLMNIMLVSVTERTREIGVRKSLGATRRNILVQFLTEAIVICQIGGIIGILFSLVIGIVITNVMGGTFVIPWKWITVGITICTVVGLISGLYPAMKAAKLDPIESLRFE